MFSAAMVEQLVSSHLQCEFLEVKGDDGQHFFATIVCQEFEGMRTIARHQRVYQALGSKMGNEIHALSMKTLSPTEWRGQSPSGD